MGLQQTLKALADPTRREILNLLKSGTKSAGEICDQFDITAAAISRHLSVLKEADLIEDSPLDGWDVSNWSANWLWLGLPCLILFEI